MSKENWGEGGLYLRGKYWWIFYPCNGQTVRESTKCTDREEADKIRRKRLKDVYSGRFSGPDLERVRVSELLDDLLKDYEIKKKTLWWAQVNVEKHLRPFFKYHYAVKIGTKQVQEYILKKRSENLADSTINRHLALLRHAFKLGMKTTPKKVLHPLIIEKLDESKNVRHGFFEHQEFILIREHLPEEIQPIATFAFYTGCRKGEILGLRWPQVDFDTKMVRLRSGETKNKRPRTIPMVDELYDALLKLRTQRDEFWAWSPWVFSRAGMQIKSFYGSWRAACKAAGFGESDKLLHDLRRTGVRNLVRAGVPERVAMEISGHKTRAIFDRYNIVSERDLRSAAELLQKHIGGDKK